MGAIAAKMTITTKLNEDNRTTIRQEKLLTSRKPTRVEITTKKCATTKKNVKAEIACCFRRLYK